MENLSKAQKFKKLERRIKINRLTIRFFRNLILCTTVLFVAGLILTLYINSLLNYNSIITTSLNASSVVIFLVLCIFNFYVKKKELENKRLDIKMYQLMKL